MTLIVVLTLIIIFFPALNYWIFKEAGVDGYKSAIPFYNYYIWLKIIGKPWWWLILMFIPFINIFMIMLFVVNTATSYEKYDLGSQALAVIFPFAYLPYLGISEKEKYVSPTVRVKPKKSPTREWVDAIIFAVVAASIIRTFMLQSYTIPTSSMEKSLLIGDFLFVDNLAYGPRIPNTPISFPFVHHTLPLTKYTKAYVEWIKFPYYRFPGFSHVKRGDAVVFNYPDGDTVALKVQDQSYYALIREFGRERVWNDKATFGNIVARPVDKRENYIKRCIALPGDMLEIKEQIVYINGQKTDLPKESEFSYIVTTDGNFLNSRTLDKLDITEPVQNIDSVRQLVTLTSETAEKLRSMPNVKSVERYVLRRFEKQDGVFPYDSSYHWNIDNFGPLQMPKAGATVKLDKRSLPLYERIITAYEHNTLKIEGNTIFINNKPADSYTFKQDYYWMMGDNRHNSADSRYWGFVPYDHIVGKASFVWLSLDKNKSLFNGKIRWAKLFRKVK